MSNNGSSSRYSENLQRNGFDEADVPDDDELLKGDAIGDTLFSESWVIKTLMKLTEVLIYFVIFYF